MTDGPADLSPRLEVKSRVPPHDCLKPNGGKYFPAKYFLKGGVSQEFFSGADVHACSCRQVKQR